MLAMTSCQKVPLAIHSPPINVVTHQPDFFLDLPTTSVIPLLTHAKTVVLHYQEIPAMLILIVICQQVKVQDAFSVPTISVWVFPPDKVVR